MIVLVIAVASVLFLLTRSRARRALNRRDAIKIIEDFLSDTGGPYDWDDFLALPICDPALEHVRKLCLSVDWTTTEGKQTIRQILHDLKRNLDTRTSEAQQIEMPVDGTACKTDSNPKD